MQKIFAIIFALISSFGSIAQNAGDVGKIALSIVVPENAEGLEPAHTSKLETKISQIITKYGLAATGYDNNFIVYPKLAIYDNSVVEGGMQNIIIITADLSLFMKQVDNNIMYATVNIPLKGSGSNKQNALTNAISMIPVDHPSFKKFVETGKLKIVQYYESKCTDIIKKSDAYVKMKKYEDAIGLLMTVPEEVSECHHKILDKAVVAYKAYQTQICSEMIQKAKTSLAANDYKGALNILSEIDPSSACYKSAQELASIAGSKIDAEEKKRWDFKMKQYNDAINLKNKRIQAIKEIAVAYYKSRPTTVNYNYILY